MQAVTLPGGRIVLGFVYWDINWLNILLACDTDSFLIFCIKDMQKKITWYWEFLHPPWTTSSSLYVYQNVFGGWSLSKNWANNYISGWSYFDIIDVM